MSRPIYDMLKAYEDENPIRLHMPGHKGVWHPLDVTEIPQSDDLNQPEGAIGEAQALLAEAYGACHSFMLVGGSTAGMKAMLLYNKLKKGGAVILPRATHKAAYNACCMYGIPAVIAESRCDDAGVSYSDESAVLRAMDQNPDASALLVTCPDYYGRCMSLEVIAKEAEALGMLLLVDEAHGAHYAFGDQLPHSAKPYADLWVNSAHKTLCAPTSGAYLHASKGVDHRLLEEALRAQRTSSPSFITLMGLDDARHDALAHPAQWDQRATACQALTDRIDAIEGIHVYDDAWAKDYGFVAKDITRLVVDVSKVGGGFHVAKRLYEDHRIQVEMADFYRIVGIMTPWDQGDCDDRVVEALRALPLKDMHVDLPSWPSSGERRMTMHEAWGQAGRMVDSAEAKGRIAATSVGCYPPGTPLILPGEVINQEVLTYLEAVEQAGGSIFGTVDKKIRVV